jgi:hypothetical protein
MHLIFKYALVSFVALGFLATGHANENINAYIVNHKNQVVGEKKIKSFEQCGQELGPAYIAEGELDNVGKLRIECSMRPVGVLSGKLESRFPNAEVRTLVNQGPSENRIDLTIVGDGYTKKEKDKFFADSEKIVQDLFGDVTFKTYLPIFNVHAIFVASRTSGIGDGRPKNTALKLYRHPRVRQAIIPGDESAAYEASALAPDSDYPILVANDDIYGGLGGAFAITSSAPMNITTVLRHELGHNFGRVGEEYDGGQVYRGANFSRSKNTHWSYWAKHNGHEMHQHTAQLIHYSAPWQNLLKSSWSHSFTTGMNQEQVLVDFSSLGLDTPDDVVAILDNQRYSYSGNFNYDRNFHKFNATLPPGRHHLRFQQKAKDTNNVISKVAIYAMPEEYPLDKGRIGAFTTYNQYGQAVGYRPTHSTCLMRDMQSRQFCDVCTENMWRNFLREVNLIDEISYRSNTVKAELLPLGERLSVEWIDPSGQKANDLKGKTEWEASAKQKGLWTLRVQFISDEVQHPKQEKWTVQEKTISVN